MNSTVIPAQIIRSGMVLLMSAMTAVAAAGGPGAFVDSGQRLGNSDSYWAALGDLDGDGDLDAFIANYRSLSRQPNRVWLNDGIGNFSDSGQLVGNLSSRVALLGDFDNDGDLDVFVGNGLEQPDLVWLNDGSGVFSDSGQRLGRVATDSAELADLNGDGYLDAFIASASAVPFGNPANLVFWGSAVGTFTDSGQRLGNSLSESVALGDLDGDDDLDAFVGNRAPFADKVWWNTGAGYFADSAQSLSTGNSFGVALGDVDDDDDLDAFIANHGGTNTVWLNDGWGAFTDSGQALGSFTSFDVKLADLDEDDDLDAFVSNSGVAPPGQPNTVWWNDASGVFTDSGQRLGNSLSSRAALADLDGDGDLDAFITNRATQPNTVWFYQPPTTPGVANALEDAGLDLAQTPSKVIEALNAADDAGLLVTIPPGTTVNENVTLQPGAAVVLGVGSTVNGNILGTAGNVVVIGKDGSVVENIKKASLCFAGASNAEVTGNLIEIRELLVGPQAESQFASNVSVENVEVNLGGTAVILGNLQVKELIVLDAAATLSAGVNLRCARTAMATIDPTANVIIGRNNLCAALP